MRLETLLKSVGRKHTKCLRPVNRENFISRQLSLGGEVRYDIDRESIVGIFYEVITKGLYGGELNRHFFENGDLDLFQPDVIDKKGKIVWESKGCLSGRVCDLRNGQVEGYKFLQLESLDSNFFIAIYRHSLRGIKLKKLSWEEIIAGLTQKTSFSIVLPFRVLSNLTNQSCHKLYGLASKSRSTGRIHINSPTINGFLLEPEKYLDYLGLNPEEFSIERFESSPTFSVNGSYVKPFLIMKISDEGDWKEGFDRNFRDSEVEGEIVDFPVYDIEGNRVPF